MEWLNYHHLLYFWTVAREGSIARATRVLGLAQPTISAQLRQLEERLGVPLFERRGRSLEQWFEAHDVRPRMVGEFDDSALLKVFAQAGDGLFAGPDAIRW